MSVTGREREPFIVAGCPARNRAWILPRWYEAMERQTRKPDDPQPGLASWVAAYGEAMKAINDFWTGD